MLVVGKVSLLQRLDFPIEESETVETLLVMRTRELPCAVCSRRLRDTLRSSRTEMVLKSLVVLIVDFWKDPGPYGVEQSWGIIDGGVDFL